MKVSLFSVINFSVNGLTRLCNVYYEVFQHRVVLEFSVLFSENSAVFSF